jgi:peptide/nickel transport system substrate-binding protein
MDNREVKRRAFLKVSATALLGAVAAACQTKEKIVTQVVTQEVEKVVQQTVEVKQTVEATKIVEATKLVTQEKEVQVTVEVPKGRSEPPFLQAKVASGELPPVDERLPESPVVVGGRDAIGVYGGEVRMMHFDPVWMTSNYDLNAERCLHYSDIDLRTIVGNIFEGWQVTPDGKEYTIMMRKGMKYSDGAPVTSEDVRFYWEDWWTDPDLKPGVPWQFRFGGENMKVDIIDDFTFKLTFAAPFGNFAAHLTRFEPNNWPSIIAPSHYLKKFHAKYTDQATLDQQAKDLGLAGWVNLASQRIAQWGCGVWRGDDWIVQDNYPVLGAWHIVERPSEGLYLWERNPYYWKVDLAGNQLPYIDTLRYDYSATLENTQLMIIQSQLDIVGMHDVTVANYPLYKENEAKADYMVSDLISCMGDRPVLFPQHYVVDESGTPDDVLNTIVNHPNFVRALSLAIDRSEINESLFYGLARMGQLAPIPSSKYYKPRYGEAYAVFDVDQANKLLDEMGLDKKDSNGIRQRPDGKPLTYQIEHCGARVGPAIAKICEMASTFWRAIGIDATAKEIQESLYNERMNGYKTQCGIWHADRCTDLLLHIEPQWYIPTAKGQGGACGAWSDWFNAADRTTATVQPPEDIQALYGDFDQMTAVVSEDERVQWGQKIFDYLADKPLEIGLVLEIPAPLLFNKNLRNLPRPKVIMGWDTYGQSTYHPEAYFYEGGVRA